MSDVLRNELAVLVAGYPIDVRRLADGLLQVQGGSLLPHLQPGPGLGIVQVGMWEADEDHPGPVYLDLDPRRLSEGRLDVVVERSHWGEVSRLNDGLQAWSSTSDSEEHRDALEQLWATGHRSPAVAVQLAAYRSVSEDDFLGSYSSQAVRQVLDEAVAADPWSGALHYQLYRRFRAGRREVETARLAHPMLWCHAWSFGTASVESVEIVLGVTSGYRPEVYGEFASLASNFTMEARLTAAQTVDDPELAVRLAVDWAFDAHGTDEHLGTLLRPLASRSREPIWTRLCDFRS